MESHRENIERICKYFWHNKESGKAGFSAYHLLKIHLSTEESLYP